MSSSFFSLGILSLHWLIVVGLSVRVIMRRPPVGVSLAWLAVIASAPFVGAILYLLFGERRLGRKRAERMAARIVAMREWQADLRKHYEATATRLEERARQISRQAEQVLGFPVQPGNAIELFGDNRKFFDALIADIDGAQTRCHLCFYIWQEGGRIEEVIEALERAAHRDVQCRVLADAIGSKGFLGSASARRLSRAGVEVFSALPTGAVRTLFIRRDLRNHRKIVVIDDRVAYTGSQNLVDPRFFKRSAGVGIWVDAMVRLSGPAVAALDAVFGQDWAVETGHHYKLTPVHESGESTLSGSMVQVLPSGPDLHPEGIYQLLLSAIYTARSELVMTTPYFVPDDAMLAALISAALRGVAVTLIVPARNDSIMVRHASVAHFGDLMAAGVQIARFDRGLLHTKSLTIDGLVSLFGSANLDMRSLWLNFEISLFVYDREFTSRLVALQQSYLREATLIDPEEWRNRPAWRRFVENTFRLLSPVL